MISWAIHTQRDTKSGLSGMIMYNTPGSIKRKGSLSWLSEGWDALCKKDDDPILDSRSGGRFLSHTPQEEKR
jgi:hypothetical protein